MPDSAATFHQQLDEHPDRPRAHGRPWSPRASPGRTQVLLDHDLGGAQQLIDGDDALDALALETEERCYRVFALQQPDGRRPAGA